MVHYLSAFFIFIIIITGLVLCFTPTPSHKSVSIADSASKVAMQNKNVIANKDEKIKNTDNIKNTHTQFNNYNNINTSDTGFYNQDNIYNVDAGVDLYDNTSQSDFGISNEDNFSTYDEQIQNYNQQYEDIDTNSKNYDNQQTPTQQKSPKAPQKPVEQPTEPQQVPSYTKSLEQTEETSQEETISWNIWRSNLGNKIADDFEQWAPQTGTYMFYFSVDNQRKISKPVVIYVGITSDEARMLPYRYLYNLQGHNILEFPTGTNREKVNVVYTIYIDNDVETKSLDASDFSDYERIR